MKISVVITTYNRKDSLERSLRSLAEQTFPVEEFEVVVVADGCSDGTDEYLRSYKPAHGYRAVIQENQGQAAAQNVGIAAATGEIVILMDDDCICDPGLVAAHYAAHRNGNRVVVIGAVQPHPHTPQGTPGDLKRQLEIAEFERLKVGGARRSDLMLCANSSIARKAALEFPFDTAYKRMHDVEAGLRLWNSGFRPQFLPDAVMYELSTKSVASVLSDARHQGRYEVLLTQKHPEFKPWTSLVRINEGNPLQRWMRKELAVHARLSEFVLAGGYGISELLRAVPLFRSIAHRVLRARIGLQHVRGAIEEAGSWKEVEGKFGKRTVVILYHNVGEPRGEYPGLTTPVAEFEAQMRLLKSMGYQSILPRDWLRWRDDGGELPDRPVMLVFDDAYEDGAKIGFPIVRRHGFAAACMVVTSCVGKTNRWDEEAGRPSFRIMSAQQIDEWSRQGIEFGGHTSTHRELTKETDERVEDEVLQCKEDLMALLGEPPVCFAYPYGSFNATAEAAVKRHFSLGFTFWPGRLHLATNPALVPRIAFLPGESKFGMWCRLRVGRNPMEVVRNRWKKLLGKNQD
jgi:glycosyltransferase involved in cell wall biosynthesis/peptidoglycan/xylan/chitin deacetylase (PgdA/CDA1 family)